MKKRQGKSGFLDSQFSNFKDIFKVSRKNKRDNKFSGSMNDRAYILLLCNIHAYAIYVNTRCPSPKYENGF